MWIFNRWYHILLHQHNIKIILDLLLTGTSSEQVDIIQKHIYKQQLGLRKTGPVLPHMWMQERRLPIQDVCGVTILQGLCCCYGGDRKQRVQSAKGGRGYDCGTLHVCPPCWSPGILSLICPFTYSLLSKLSKNLNFEHLWTQVLYDAIKIIIGF